MAKRSSTPEDIATKLRETSKVEKKAPSSVNRIANLGDFAHPPKKKKKK